MKHTKRYILTVQEWGIKTISYADNTQNNFLNSTDIEFDTIEEADAWIKDVEEYYKLSNIERPDVNSNKKYEKIVAKEGKFPEIYYTEETYIHDENHFWWGYVLMDFEEEKCVRYGGLSIKGYLNPTKSLSLKDKYFLKDGEIPKDYVWDGNEEYEGWLQYRWGNGENAIEKVRKRKAREKELANIEYQKNKLEKAEEEEYLRQVEEQAID